MEKKKGQNTYNDFPLYVFHQGRNFKAQEFLGAHKVSEGKYVFRVWAPHANAVFVVGDFNGWDENACPMYRISDGGVWECYAEGVENYIKTVDRNGFFEVTGFSDVLTIE